MSLKTIKGKIRSVNKTRKVTKAMEAVSAVKMRKSQERALSGRPYARAALSILKRVSSSREAQSHPLVAPRAATHAVALVVVSSDKGLCGALNAALFKKTHTLIRERGWNIEDIAVFAIGKKAYEHFSSRGFTIALMHHAPEAGTELEEVEKTASRIITEYLATRFDEAYIVYTNFRSTFEQEPYARKLLPVSFSSLEELVSGIAPEKGKYAHAEINTDSYVATYTIEPTPEAVLNELIPALIAIELYHAYLESAASEHSARMVAMKNASDKAAEVSHTLTLTFNKARQAIITREVSEIVGGMEVMK